MDSNVAKSLKLEILLSLKTEISAVIKSEMKNALAVDFDFLKKELHALKAEVKNNIATIRLEIDQMKTTVHDMETGLSTWADKVMSLQATVNTLKSEMVPKEEPGDETSEYGGCLRRTDRPP